ncbi:hypothetical protein G6F68_010906 [Rhizopus microsporus]|nr:hypothetical protein G6F68_010906 [Rhizopus microsporus]
MFLVVQHQVLHAGLDAGVMAFLPVHVADLEPARGRHVHRVGARAGFRPDLVDQRGGQVFDQRRMRPHERVPARVAGVNQARNVLARHLLHLVVHAASQPGRRNQAEGVVEVVFLDARNAARRGFERRELEGADAAFDQPGGRLQPMLRVQRAEQRNVHMAVALDFGDLGVQLRARGDGFRIVLHFPGGAFVDAALHGGADDVAAVFAIERQCGFQGGLEGAAHAVDQLGLAGPAYLVAGQVQFPAAHPRGAVGAFQEILAALQLAVQGLGLADLRHQRAALFQHLGGDPGQVHHQFALRRRQHAGHRVEQAQRADARTVRRAQRDAGVVADARAAAHPAGWCACRTRFRVRSR